MARKELPKLVKGDVPVVQNQHPERRAERHRLGGACLHVLNLPKGLGLGHAVPMGLHVPFPTTSWTTQRSASLNVIPMMTCEDHVLKHLHRASPHGQGTNRPCRKSCQGRLRGARGRMEQVIGKMVPSNTPQYRRACCGKVAIWPNH